MLLSTFKVKACCWLPVLNPVDPAGLVEVTLEELELEASALSRDHGTGINFPLELDPAAP